MTCLFHEYQPKRLPYLHVINLLLLGVQRIVYIEQNAEDQIFVIPQRPNTEYSATIQQIFSAYTSLN